MLKKKCIYYNPVNNGYYLVLSVTDMIYGRYGCMENPTYLDRLMNQDGTGLRFKIGDIIINKSYCRNYRLDNQELDKFELVRELTDEEFYPIDLLIDSRFKYPEITIDVHKHMREVTNLVNIIQNKKYEVTLINRDIRSLEKRLFLTMSEES